MPEFSDIVRTRLWREGLEREKGVRPVATAGLVACIGVVVVAAVAAEDMPFTRRSLEVDSIDCTQC